MRTYFNVICQIMVKLNHEDRSGVGLFFHLLFLCNACTGFTHHSTRRYMWFCHPYERQVALVFLTFSLVFSLCDRKLLSLCYALQWWWLTRVWPVEKTTTSELRAKGKWGLASVCVCVWTTQTLITRGRDHKQQRLCSGACIFVPVCI